MVLPHPRSNERGQRQPNAWIISGLGILFAVANGNSSAIFSPYFWIVIFITLGCFIAAVRTIPGLLDKIAGRLPGSIAPRRKPIAFLVATLSGIMLLALLSTNADALLTASFRV